MYRRRRDRLIAALDRYAPGVGLTGIAAGLHAVALLPADHAEESVVEAAARHGVAVDGLRHYAAEDPDGTGRPEALVIGYGRPAEHAFTTALSRLCAALAETA